MAKIAGTQVLVMFILIGVGYFFAKKSWISRKGSEDLNKLMLYIVTPCIIISSYNRPFDKDLFGILSKAFLLAVISHFIAICVSFLLIKGKETEKKLERFAVIFSNGGFMGIPLVAALLGSENIIIATVYVMVFNLTQWTVGVLILTGRTSIKDTVKKLILNPGVISIAIGFIIFIFSIKLPSPVSTAVNYISNLHTPIAMILIGSYMARTKILSYFTNPRVYYISLLRLILIPLLMIPVYFIFPANNFFIIANFVATACPVAALAAMFPANYGYDPDYSTGFIAVSTILSVITIPLMTMIFSSIASLYLSF
jgi:predicted permease